jgi:hypothetical protein
MIGGSTWLRRGSDLILAFSKEIETWTFGRYTTGSS